MTFSYENWILYKSKIILENDSMIQIEQFIFLANIDQIRESHVIYQKVLLLRSMKEQVYHFFAKINS